MSEPEGSESEWGGGWGPRGEAGKQDERARWSAPGRGGRRIMKPLEGIRVLEVAMYGFVPSAGAGLADRGAEGVKGEHSGSRDPPRGLPLAGGHRGRGAPH